MLLPLRQIFQEMAAEKLRLILTIFAVAWATLCIAGMLAVGEGLRAGIIRVVQNGNGNLIHITGGIAGIDNGTFYQGKALDLKARDAEILQTLPAVARALPSTSWQEELRYGDQYSWRKPTAVSAGYKQMNHLKVMPGGRWFNPLDAREERQVIVLGYATAAGLFNDEEAGFFDTVTLQADPVGKKVKLGDKEFTVIGVLKKNSGRIESGNSINYASFVPLATWQSFHRNQAVDAINVLPGKGVDRVALAGVLKQLLIRRHGASLKDQEIVQVQDMFLEQKSMQSFLIGLQSFLGIIGLITLMVAGVGIANVMYATVRRSTRDIGVRMAVGATPAAIRLHYLVQSLLTMALGGLLGLVMTYGVVVVIQVLPLSGNMVYEELGQPVPQLSWMIITIVISTLVLIGIAAAWLPANKAAQITPLQALQSE
ncbi:ABC transporter permease [Vibrio quintilis]|uniref:Macrolide export ATP-binding/permease protein MacB n=1 Tax=Vibrio quintilis TaxID=1117707 RepID=A0A1M7YX20_9VIBR|nr:ABC transporter permease [Vibrio quintilis]SHO57174.1 Macrolide export ATP-binding/permease protein MacB [Vibrio quintilis]